jgi:DNA repair exonuclease SbcCD ATPase subunit
MPTRSGAAGARARKGSSAQTKVASLPSTISEPISEGSVADADVSNTLTELQRRIGDLSECSEQSTLVARLKETSLIVDALSQAMNDFKQFQAHDAIYSRLNHLSNELDKLRSLSRNWAVEQGENISISQRIQELFAHVKVVQERVSTICATLETQQETLRILKEQTHCIQEIRETMQAVQQRLSIAQHKMDKIGDTTLLPPDTSIIAVLRALQTDVAHLIHQRSIGE